MPNQPCGDNVCDSCPEVETCKKETFDRDLAIATIIGDLGRERDSLRAQLAEVNAGAAQMREALELAGPHIFSCSDCQCVFSPPQPPCLTCAIRKAKEAATAALSSSAGRSYLKYVHGLEGLPRRFAQAPQEMQAMMRREGFAIDNLEDRWQKLAFTLYTRIVSMATESDAYLKEADKRG